MTSVVVPAHNEAAMIGRLLRGLLDTTDAGELDIVVVCNGCTDDTAEVARTAAAARARDVRVVEIAVASKPAALERGDREVRGFPRVYVDADVELGGEDIRALSRGLERPGVLACAPARVLPLDRVSPVVRWYYDVWQALPQVESGLFGRGVIAVSELGHQRLDWTAASTSDDLVVSESFAEHERAVVSDAAVVVHPPRTVDDLLRRRIRVIAGNEQADAAGLRGASARTGLRELAQMARAQPRLVPRIPVFVGVTVAARLGHRRRQHRGEAGWLRDESSRHID